MAFQKRRLDRILFIRAAAKISNIMRFVDFQCFKGGLGAVIFKMMTCQFNEINADIGKQINIFWVTAKDERDLIRLWKGAAGGEWNMISDVGNIRLPHQVTDSFTRI